MLRQTLVATLCLVSSAAYGASSSTPTIAIESRIDAVTGCEVTSNIGAPLTVTVSMLDANGRLVTREPITLAGFSSRVMISLEPVDGFHCRFVSDGGKAQYMGAAKYYFINADGVFTERGYLDR
jgi:hypothetical protein